MSHILFHITRLYVWLSSYW